MSAIKADQSAMPALLTLGLFSAFGPSVTPYAELAINILHRFAPPMTGTHLFGTDSLGRDLAVRLMMAGRVPLTVAVADMLISTAVGVVVGTVAGRQRAPVLPGSARVMSRAGNLHRTDAAARATARP